MISAVQNAGNWDSYWAFVAAGAVESAYAIKQKTSLIDLSEQQLIDCSDEYGNYGCTGGLATQGMEYLQYNKFCYEDDYKYIARDDSCHSSDCSHTIQKIQGTQNIESCDLDEFLEAIEKGPIAAAVNSKGDGWANYEGGIIQSDNCSSNVDRGVLIVGYKDGHFIVKNHEGTKWGESGYARLSADGNNGWGTCGIMTQGTFPKLS